MKLNKLIVILAFVLLGGGFVAVTKAVTPAIASVKALSAFAHPTYIPGKSVLRVQFVRLNLVKNVSYVLTYDNNGITQGIVGSFIPSKKSTVQLDLFIGTCSTGVCIKHKNAKNIVLEVTFEYKNGSTSVEKYSVKK